MPYKVSFVGHHPSDLGLLTGKAYQALALIGEGALELIMPLWMMINHVNTSLGPFV